MNRQAARAKYLAKKGSSEAKANAETTKLQTQLLSAKDLLNTVGQMAKLGAAICAGKKIDPAKMARVTMQSTSLQLIDDSIVAGVWATAIGANKNPVRPALSQL